MQMNVDKQIFESVERIKQLMATAEAADELCETGITPVSLVLASDVWRKAMRELTEATESLARREPQTLPAAAAIAEAAMATGSPLLIAGLRDALLRMAIRQTDEHQRARLEDETPIGFLPSGTLNCVN